MTYDTGYLAQDYLGYIKALQRHVGNEAHALHLARALEVRVRVGLLNRSYPDAEDGPRVVVQPWHYRDSDVLRHELAHVMLWWSGLEAEIIGEFGEDLGWHVIENLCSTAVGWLKITQPMVDEAVRLHGVSALAVRHLQDLSGARPSMAMRRLIYDDPAAERAGFLTSGYYIQEVAQCNWSLPFGWLDRVPDPALLFPRGARVSFSNHLGQVVGIAWGH